MISEVLASKRKNNNQSIERHLFEQAAQSRVRKERSVSKHTKG
jgi:hypothetical protein